MKSAKERRVNGRVRLPLGSGVAGVIHLPGTGRVVAVEAVDLSLGGVGLRASARDLGRALRYRASLTSRGQPLTSALEPVHARPARDGAVQLGLRFRGLDEPQLHEICRLILAVYLPRAQPAMDSATRELGPIDSPTHVRRFLSHAGDHRSAFWGFRGDDGSYVGRLRVDGLEGDDEVVASLEDGATALHPGDALICTLSSLNTLYRFRTIVTGRRGRELWLRWPDGLWRGGVRSAGRTRIDPRRPVVLEFLHPSLPGRLVRKALIDASVHGVSFCLDLQRDLLVPGLGIHSAQLRLWDGRTIACALRLRHVFAGPRGGYRCGAELVGFAGSARQVWAEAVVQSLAPDVLEVAPDGLDDVWDLFERSRYLEEKPIERMVAARDSFFQVWRDILMSRGTSRIWMYRDAQQGDNLATISLSRLYSRAWIGHQFAADLDAHRGPVDKLLIPFALVPKVLFNWLAGVSDEGHLIGFYDADRPFNQWAWFDFFERYDDGEDCRIEPLQLYDFEVAAQRAPAPRAAGAIWVRTAADSDRRWVSAELLRREGPLLHRALDYHADRLSLSGWPDDDEGDRLRRHRGVWVAGADDQPIAFALAESAAAGVSLFSLYNTARVFVTDARHRAAEEAVQALFFTCVEYYRERELASFLYLVGAEDPPPPRAAVASFEARARRVTTSSTLLPRWMGWLGDLWGHR